MATASTPTITYVSTLMSLTGVNQSSSLTVTINVVGWEAQVPIQFSHLGSISADPILNIFRSMDGGANWDSNAWQSFALPRAGGVGNPVSGSRTTSVTLPTGQYVLQLLNSGPNSALFAVLTQLVITAVNNA